MRPEVLSGGILQLSEGLVGVVCADVSLQLHVDPAFNLVELGGVSWQVERGDLVSVPLQELHGFSALVEGSIVHD